MKDTGNQVDELWLAAPFYDPDAAAVGALIATFRPRRVHLVAARSTSVNGDRLTKLLNACGARVTVATYQPDRFVHGKLIGVTAGKHAWLLSGSANLSRAALMLTPATHGNIEPTPTPASCPRPRTAPRVSGRRFHPLPM